MRGITGEAGRRLLSGKSLTCLVWAALDRQGLARDDWTGTVLCSACWRSVVLLLALMSSVDPGLLTPQSARGADALSECPDHRSRLDRIISWSRPVGCAVLWRQAAGAVRRKVSPRIMSAQPMRAGLLAKTTATRLIGLFLSASAFAQTSRGPPRALA
jgi:hypothetical protein